MEAFNAILEDFDEMGRTYEVELAATLRVELMQRG